MPKLSLIIPIYNAEEYLKECLDSAVSQTLQDIEIILVDDGSKDTSGKICDEYAEKDPRIKVIHKENGGVCDARNVGIANASANWFTFLESDDWLPLDACERLYTKMEEKNAEFVMGAYYKVVSAGTFKKAPLKEKFIFFDKDSIRENLLRDIMGLTGERLKTPGNIDTFLTDTAKLFNTEIVRKNNIQWISRKEIYSDCLDFILRYASCCESAVYFDDPIYYYRRTNENSQTAAYRPKTVELWNVQFETMEKFIEDNGLQNLYPAYYSRVCFSIIPIGGNVYRMKNIKKALKELKVAFSNPIYKKAFSNFDIGKLPIHFRPLFWFAKYKCYILFYGMTVVMRKIMNRQRELKR